MKSQTPRSAFPAMHECQCKETLLRVQQENQQLRRELEDAHYRIHELQQQATIWVSDDASVEVQSIADLSTTSSTTTVPTGSSLANEKRAQLEQRQERQQQRKPRSKWRTISRKQPSSMLKISESDDSSFSGLFRGPGNFVDLLYKTDPDPRDSLSSFLQSLQSADSSDVSAILNEKYDDV